MRYWLLKTEPTSYSIEDLKRDTVTMWDGVRNYQARNFLRDELKRGDRVLFYHSSTEPIGIAGVAEVVKEGYPDPTAFDPKDHHYDPDSKKDNPRWYVVDIKFVEAFKVIPLSVLKKERALGRMPLLQRGQRLSVQPVAKGEFEHVLKMAKRL